MAELLWVLNIKILKIIPRFLNGARGKKNHVPHHPFPEKKLSFKSVAERENKLCLGDF